MALILVPGVVCAWRVSRGNPRDTLRSIRFKHLSYAIFGAWLLILAVVLFLAASADSRVMRGLVLGVYFGFPLVAAVILALGQWTHRGEQRAARADQLALGLTVAPRRISPHTLALLYGIGLFTVVPLAVAAGVLAIASAAGERPPGAQYSTVLWMVLSVVGLSYGPESHWCWCAGPGPRYQAAPPRPGKASSRHDQVRGSSHRQATRPLSALLYSRSVNTLGRLSCSRGSHVVD